MIFNIQKDAKLNIVSVGVCLIKFKYVVFKFKPKIFGLNRQGIVNLVEKMLVLTSKYDHNKNYKGSKFVYVFLLSVKFSTKWYLNERSSYEIFNFEKINAINYGAFVIQKSPFLGTSLYSIQFIKKFIKGNWGFSVISVLILSFRHDNVPIRSLV